MNVSGIVKNSVVDGPGVRMGIFLQGCPHHCKGCHNPDTWDYEGKCFKMSVNEILEIFDNDTILSGITLSGGEPFSPIHFKEVSELCKAIKERKRNVWAYTGYTIEALVDKYPEVKENILPYVDVLVDGPFIIEERDFLCTFRGSKNQKLIDVAKYLKDEENYIIE